LTIKFPRADIIILLELNTQRVLSYPSALFASALNRSCATLPAVKADNDIASSRATVESYARRNLNNVNQQHSATLSSLLPGILPACTLTGTLEADVTTTFRLVALLKPHLGDPSCLLGSETNAGPQIGCARLHVITSALAASNMGRGAERAKRAEKSRNRTSRAREREREKERPILFSSALVIQQLNCNSAKIIVVLSW
jgi:hypothetical protein